MRVLGINGSASSPSSNLAILQKLGSMLDEGFILEIVDDLAKLPHFETDNTDRNVPEEVVRFRQQIERSDGIVICTPEYVFSIPSRLKNAIEWCVSTTVFSDKPVGIITASASGAKGHEELKLIMRTIQARVAEESALLIQGVKGKIAESGQIKDGLTEHSLRRFAQSFCNLVKKYSQP